MAEPSRSEPEPPRGVPGGPTSGRESAAGGPQSSRSEPTSAGLDEATDSRTAAQLDAALEAIVSPGRLEAAEALVARAAPSLQRVLANALQEGGWFDDAHEQAVREAITREDPHERVRAVQTLLAEETRLGMLVGVAVGYELARELRADEDPPPPSTPHP